MLLGDGVGNGGPGREGQVERGGERTATPANKKPCNEWPATMVPVP